MNIYKELENPQLAKRLMEMFCDLDEAIEIVKKGGTV